MSSTGVVFEDAASYEAFMGGWSRKLGAEFLAWLSPPDRAQWLDVGCGTGVFTELISGGCQPSLLVGVDPAATQLAFARRRSMTTKAEFQEANALSLPFPDQSFDVVVSALVLNFIPDRPRALSEMHRVCRIGGLVAAYVWDFAGGQSMVWPVLRGLQAAGVGAPRFPGNEDSSTASLASLFERAGYEAISTDSIEAEMNFTDFDAFWTSQVPVFSTHGKIIAALSEPVRKQVIEATRAVLTTVPNGRIAYSARASAIKARYGTR